MRNIQMRLFVLFSLIVVLGFIGCSNQAPDNDGGVIIDCQDKKDCPNNYECVNGVCVIVSEESELEPDGADVDGEDVDDGGSYDEDISDDEGGDSEASSQTTGSWHIDAASRDAWSDGAGCNLDQSAFGDSQWKDAAGFQFAVYIPKGATIESAVLDVWSHNHWGETGSYTAGIRIEDSDNAAAFSCASTNEIKDRTYLQRTVDWPIPEGGLPIGQWSSSPDIASLIQQIVDRPGWSSGNYLSIAVWGETSAGGSKNYFRGYGSGQLEIPRLTVNYSNDGLGPELVVNGDFSNWTNDDPDGWNMDGEVGSDPMITEVEGACRLYSSGAWLSIQQYNILEAGKNYRLTVDILSVANGGIRFQTSSGDIEIGTFSTIGSKYVEFASTNHELEIKRVTGSGDDVTFDNVSIREILP
jgi:hypothetical protein